METSLTMIRQALAPYARPSDAKAISILICDLLGYGLCIALIVIVDHVLIQMTAGVIAGTIISSLFTIGHDAAHQAFTSKRWLNNLIGRIVFLPSLHNFTLWLREHNRKHHWAPNVKGLNSWSPITKEEYENLSNWRRWNLRFMRSPVGTSLYYISDRWWRSKFFPRPSEEAWRSRAAWRDFALLVVYAITFLGGLVTFSVILERNVWLVLTFGAVVPYLVWNQLMGLSIFLQHTHPRVPWFRTEKEASDRTAQTDVTIHVQFPRWFGLFTHNIMEHPAHHVNPSIPCYKLHSAQSTLNKQLGPRANIDKASIGLIWDIFRRCKLYDYDNHVWLDFKGSVTAVSLLSASAAAVT